MSFLRSFSLVFVFALLSFPSILVAAPSVQVGISLPLSGIVAEMGTAFLQGAKLFQEHFPEQTEHLDLYFDDHRYEGKQVLSSFHHLTEQKKIDLFVVWGNTPTEVVAPLAQRKGIPTLAFSMSPNGNERDKVVTFGNPIENGIGAIIKYFKRMNVDQPGVLSVNIGNALEAIEMIHKEIPNLHPIELVKSELTDFRSLISRLKSSKTGGLFVLLLPEQSLSFAKQAKQLHFDVPIIGGDVWADDKLSNQLHQYFPRLAYVYGDVLSEFIHQYREKYGNTSYIFEAACGYEALSLVSALPADWRSLPFAEALKKTTPPRSVIPGLTFENRQGFGPHFSSKVRVYEVG